MAEALSARNPFSLEGNVAAAVDQLILPGRKYFATWDPEGILTTVPALAVTIAGMLAGKILSTGPQSRGNISLWFVGAGIAAFNLAFLWDFVLPINPYLWTSSFCMVAIAAGLILLGLLHAAFERAPSRPGRSLLPYLSWRLAATHSPSCWRRWHSRTVRPTAPRLSLIQTLFPEASPTIPSVTLIAIVVIAVALWLNGRRSYFIA